MPGLLFSRPSVTILLLKHKRAKVVYLVAVGPSPDQPMPHIQEILGKVRTDLEEYQSTQLSYQLTIGRYCLGNL